MMRIHLQSVLNAELNENSTTSHHVDFSCILPPFTSLNPNNTETIRPITMNAYQQYIITCSA